MTGFSGCYPFAGDGRENVGAVNLSYKKGAEPILSPMFRCRSCCKPTPAPV
jgi:hypothetical protein